MAQWAPYNMVSYPPGDMHPIMSPMNLPGCSETTADPMRPHSVAFGQSFYPPMHFQWQQQQQQPPDLTKGHHHHVSGLLFPGHPDLVSSQPCYSNQTEQVIAMGNFSFPISLVLTLPKQLLFSDFCCNLYLFIF